MNYNNQERHACLVAFCALKNSREIMCYDLFLQKHMP